MTETLGVRTVWVDAWQMQCCGQSFSTGDKVSWTLVSPDHEFASSVLGPDIARSVTDAEDHHIDAPADAPVTTATVDRIRAVFCRYAALESKAKALFPVPGSGLIEERSSANGWEAEPGDVRFVSYLVDLK